MGKRWSNGELVTPQKYVQIGQELNDAYNVNMAYYQKQIPIGSGISITYPVVGNVYTKMKTGIVSSTGLPAGDDYFPTVKLDVKQPNALVRLFGYLTFLKQTSGEHIILDVLVDNEKYATDYRGYDLDPMTNSDGLSLVRSLLEYELMSWDVMLLGVEQGEHIFDLVYRNAGTDLAGGLMTEGSYGFYVQEYGLLTINE